MKFVKGNHMKPLESYCKSGITDRDFLSIWGSKQVNVDSVAPDGQLAVHILARLCTFARQ